MIVRGLGLVDSQHLASPRPLVLSTWPLVSSLQLLLILSEAGGRFRLLTSAVPPAWLLSLQPELSSSCSIFLGVSLWLIAQYFFPVGGCYAAVGAQT